MTEQVWDVTIDVSALEFALGAATGRIRPTPRSPT